MKGRQQGEETILWAIAEHVHGQPRVGQQLAVPQHDALGSACGAGRIDDQGRRFECAAGLAQWLGYPGQGGFVFTPNRSALAVRQQANRHLAEDVVGQDGQVRGLSDDAAGAAIFEQNTVLAGGVEGVDRDRHGAGQASRDEEFIKRPRITEKAGHPVAGHDTGFHQQRRQPLGTSEGLGIAP